MNKKGFIRTLESVMAIVLLLGLVLFIFDDDVEEIKKRPEVVENANNFITNEILHDVNLRNCFLQVSSGSEGSCVEKVSSIGVGSSSFDCRNEIKKLLDTSTPPGYSYKCEVCRAARSCATFTPPIPEGKSIYPKSAFLYLVGDNGDEVRVVRIYLFESA